MVKRRRGINEQAVYGDVVYWMSVAACLICIVGPVVSVALPQRNMLDPHYAFIRLFEGQAPDAIWNSVEGGYPGGHFYTKRYNAGDGITHLGMALIGCASAAFGLMFAGYIYARKRLWLYMALSLWIVLLTAFSMFSVFDRLLRLIGLRTIGGPGQSGAVDGLNYIDTLRALFQ